MSTSPTKALKPPTNQFFENFFSLECVLPTQLGRRYAHPYPGARRLCLAVLESAVGDLIRVVEGGLRTPRHLARFRGLIAWFGERNSQWPFSFEQLCATLELDPDAVCDQIRHWYARKRPSHNAPRTKDLFPGQTHGYHVVS